MLKRSSLCALAVSLSLAGLAISTGGCDKQDNSQSEATGKASSKIADVPHTTVERQSIGNCWLYAQASWVESLNLAAISTGGGGGTESNCAHSECEEGGKLEADCSECAAKMCAPDVDPYCCNTEWDNICVDAVASVCGAEACTDDGGGEDPEVVELDVSQSYWTYWHWFDQVTGYMYKDEISTGGNQWTSHALVRDRGIMNEADFIPEDGGDGVEMSNRQSSAKSKINTALKSGDLSTREARQDGKLVRQVFDKAWGLTESEHGEDVRKQLDKAFGEDGEGSLRQGGSVEGTKIIDAGTLAVRYTKRNGDNVEVLETNLLQAVREWNTVRYPRSNSARREFLLRVQHALHDRQPVVITWDVDFNAMENGQNERRGAFNMKTLELAGRPGSQGGHMTVLEDYEAETEDFGVLKAGVTLDPTKADDAAKLAAALLPSTKIKLLRVKNSWGANRPDRAFAPGFPGYHDLWMDYLNGPIKFCPSVDNPTNENCTGESIPLRDVMLPPGY